MAVTQPIRYAKQKGSRRAYLALIPLTWVVLPGSSHLGRLVGRLVADSARHELHRPAQSDADAVHVLQLGLSHLLVDGVLLHPVSRHARPLLQNVPLHSTDGAQVSTSSCD